MKRSSCRARRGAVREPHAPELERLARRHEDRVLALDAVVARDDGGVADAVAALVAGGLRLHRLPAERPVAARVAVPAVDPLAPLVADQVLLPAGEAVERGVRHPRVAASRPARRSCRSSPGQMTFTQGRGVSGRVMTYSRPSALKCPYFVWKLLLIRSAPCPGEGRRGCPGRRRRSLEHTEARVPAHAGFGSTDEQSA